MQVIGSLPNVGADAGEAVPVLIDLIENFNGVYVHEEAAAALAKIGPDAKDAVPALIKLLNTSHKDDVLMQASIALGNIGPDAKNAVPAFNRVLEFADDSLREEIESALRKIAGTYD